MCLTPASRQVTCDAPLLSREEQAASPSPHQHGSNALLEKAVSATHCDVLRLTCGTGEKLDIVSRPEHKSFGAAHDEGMTVGVDEGFGSPFLLKMRKFIHVALVIVDQEVAAAGLGFMMG